jgi:hypothetical protein
LQEFLAKIQAVDERAVEAMLQELDPFLRPGISLSLLDGLGGFFAASRERPRDVAARMGLHHVPNFGGSPAKPILAGSGSGTLGFRSATPH